MQGRIFTKNFQIEKRQHKLLVDLGYGVPRAAVVFGAIVFVINTLIWLVVFHRITAANSLVFLAPPILITFFGSRRMESIPGRRHYTQWLVNCQYLITGITPVVNGADGHSARRRARAQQWPLMVRGFVARHAPKWGRRDARDAAAHAAPYPVDCGAAIAFRPTVTVHGSDRTASAILRVKAAHQAQMEKKK